MVKIAKRGSQDPACSSLQMKIRQYLVMGRKLPTEQDPQPKVYAIRLFARNDVMAKSKFWYHLRKQLKTKSAQGQILSVNQIYEKRPNHVKTFGIILRYQSRTSIHNMYKEYRDVSLNGAVSQLHMEMAGNHRASEDTISIIRTAVLNESANIRRPKSTIYRRNDLKFPIIRTVARASQKRYRRIFKANRPNTFRQ
jgi:large subunit ribosomal protein L18Ae